MGDEYTELIDEFTRQMMDVDAPIERYIEAINATIGELVIMLDVAKEDLKRK